MRSRAGPDFGSLAKGLSEDVSMTDPAVPTRLHRILIKPSHYDDDGYVIEWLRSAIPSNTLAALYGLVADCRDRAVLGPDVDLTISTCWRGSR